VLQLPAAEQPGDEIVLELRHHDGRAHLPIVKLGRAA
jgi:hypothetical protein